MGQEMSKKEPFIINTAPGEAYGEKFRFWQGCPTILRTRGGRLFAGWYSGGMGEPHPENYNLLIRSEDDGMTWNRPELVISGRGEEDSIAIDIQLWLDPQGRMWLFFVRLFSAPGSKPTDPDHWTTWAMICEDPDAETLNWSKPRQIFTGFLRTQPTVLSDGSWVTCAYDRSSEYLCYAQSRDQGRTWVPRHAGRRLTNTFDEIMILERNDHSLMMFARDQNPLLVKCECSNLEQKDWSDGRYTGILNSSSRFFLRRLKSGRIILIHNDSSRQRTNLTAELSDDDGKTWSSSIVLDSAANVSYPDAVESDDGRIFIIYDCGRMTFKEIRMAQITEEDIIAGTLVNYDSYRARIISKAPGNPDPKIYSQKMQEWKQWKSLRFIY
ncbi:MAG: exo-alpha-sialidase [Lentisphaeria bacterium]|nr:exo-alpha-sialidase [Lentisphaeria bacterium]